MRAVSKYCLKFPALYRFAFCFVYVAKLQYLKCNTVAKCGDSGRSNRSQGEDSEQKITRQAEREDGQLLILPSIKEEAGALSGPTTGSSTDGKVTTTSAEKQPDGRGSSIKEGTVDVYEGKEITPE